MKKSQEFLINRLKKLVEIFPEIQVRYDQDENTFSHRVEVLPYLIYSKSPEYMLLENELEEDFEKKFPRENIIFISEGSLITIKKNKKVLFDSTKKECA